jgi:tetratricopeptide (TPR) repeat protein
VWDKAVLYSQQAGARAYDRAAFREAVASFEQALQALEHLREPSDTRALAIELRLVLGCALAALGEYRRCRALFGEAEALARTLDDRGRLGWALAEMANVLRRMGDHDSALVAGRQALELAVERGESALQVYASHILGQAYAAIGDFGQAAVLWRRNVEAADREVGTSRTVLHLRIHARAWLARTLSVLGEFAEGRCHGEEALRLAMLEGRGDTPIVAHSCLGLLYLTQGDLEHTIRVLEQGIVLCRASGNRDWLQGITMGLGHAYALQGQRVEGRALLEEAIREGIRAGALHSPVYARLSEVCCLAGRGEEAWQHARQALDLARQQKARGDEALALHQLGVVHAHADPPDAAPAEAHYRQALTLADELGMRPLQAHCHRDLGILYVATSQREQARTALSTAIALYTSMDMTFWLPQAQAALAQVEGR